MSLVVLGLTSLDLLAIDQSPTLTFLIVTSLVTIFSLPSKENDKFISEEVDEFNVILLENFPADSGMYDNNSLFLDKFLSSLPSAIIFPSPKFI